MSPDFTSTRRTISVASAEVIARPEAMIASRSHSSGVRYHLFPGSAATRELGAFQTPRHRAPRGRRKAGKSRQARAVIVGMMRELPRKNQGRFDEPRKNPAES